jgi:hypothetical protein
MEDRSLLFTLALNAKQDVVRFDCAAIVGAFVNLVDSLFLC